MNSAFYGLSLMMVMSQSAFRVIPPWPTSVRKGRSKKQGGQIAFAGAQLLWAPGYTVPSLREKPCPAFSVLSPEGSAWTQALRANPAGGLG